MKNLRTKNFTTYEVIHREPDKLPKELESVAYIAQGMIQGFRNHLKYTHGKPIRIQITSGYRSPSYNQEIGGSKNSYHMWRYNTDSEPIWALDIWSPDIDKDELYRDAAAFFEGEVYMHGHYNLVHVSNYGVNEDLGTLF